MNKFVVCLMLFFSYSHCTAQSSFFIENKGQIKDQFGFDRQDVRYALNYKEQTLFITDQGFSIQFNHQIDSLNVSSNRIDYQIRNFKPTSFVKSEPRKYHENYILGAQQITVKSYGSVIARDDLSGIQVAYSCKEEGFKYDIILPETYERTEIEIDVKGAVVSSKADELIISNGINSCIETMPEVYSFANNARQVQQAHYELSENGYKIKFDEFDGQLVIDPYIVYSTFYGGEYSEHAYGVASDSVNNTYAIGTTSSSSNIATSGAYQSTYVNTGNMFIVKFNELGERQWGTYYNTSYPNARKIEIDGEGNIYMAGMAGLGSNFGTVGTHQTVFGGDFNDVFLLKLNPDGFPIWSTYFGGEGNDILNGMAVVDDAIYLAGYTSSHTQIATPGSFQDTTTVTGWNYDGYIAKFDTTGNLLLATYVGGYNDDKLNDIKYYDHNLYVVGAFNTWDKGTPGAYLPTKTSNSDLYFSKFDENLNQIWGSYFTGNRHAEGYHKIAVNLDKIYIAAYVSSDGGNSSYSTPGVHKEFGESGAETYIEIFDTSGTNWIKGTFFGGAEGDYPIDIEVINDSMFAVVGATISLDQIATSDVHKNYFTYSSGGWSLNNDVFVTVFNDSLDQVWGSYYGGEGDDYPYDLVVNKRKQLIISGRTTSQNGMTQGYSHQQFNGGVGSQPDGFIAVFDADRDSIFTDAQMSLPSQLCPKETAVIPFEVLGTYYEDNVFELWMSDEFGDFNNATLLSSATGQTSASFNYQLPYLVSNGNYQFRVDATSPQVEGLVSGSVMILESPLANFNYQIGSSDVYFTDASNSANSWSWDFNDGNFSIDQNPTHVFNAAGMYNVSLVATNTSCSDTAYHQVLIEEVLEVEMNDKSLFKIFPNPSNDAFNIDIGDVSGELTVKTIEGKIVLRQRVSNNEKLSLDLESGIYFVSLNDTNKKLIEIKKVMKL